MKTKNMGVRISLEQRKALDEMAKHYKVKAAQLVIWGIDAILEYAERHGGRLTLPINFDESIEVKNLASKLEAARKATLKAA